MFLILLFYFFIIVNTTPIYIGKTFRHYVQKEAWRTHEMNDLQPILNSIEIACADINRLIRRVNINNLVGIQNYINIQGEEQQKLDKLANTIMKNSICCSGKVYSVISEEETDFCKCSKITDNNAFNGEYIVVFDPLDGSSNINCCLPTGTIFGIYKRDKFMLVNNNNYESCLKGSKLILSGYCLYSSSTNLVICYSNKINMFMFDDTYNQFILSNENVKIPDKGNIVSFNEANYKSWDNNIKSYITDTKNKGYTSRYMGALVADTHNILINGGVFGYPSTNKNNKGKIRIVYEANPISHIIETAGGIAINGTSEILKVPINNIHQRTPFFFGSKEDISLLENYLQD
jgi:fructose-1,6-bisphosphatase I